jgi:hypothetical protein
MLDPQEPGSQVPASFQSGHIARRLHALATARLETGEELSCWCRAWVSRDGRLSGVFGARTRDFAVLTDRRLMLWSTGFFTRLPKRRVLTDRLDDHTIENIGRRPNRSLRIRAFARRPLRFEFSSRPAAQEFVSLLVERAGPKAAEAPPVSGPYAPEESEDTAS